VGSTIGRRAQAAYRKFSRVWRGLIPGHVRSRIVAMAADLLVWTQTLAFTDHPARRWEPKRLRLRLLTVAGRIICSGRRRRLRLPRGWPWNDLVETAWAALQSAQHPINIPTTKEPGEPADRSAGNQARPTAKDHAEPSTTRLEPRLTKDRG
jgi:hypothetical protein